MANDFKRRITRALSDHALRTTLTRSTGILREARARALADQPETFAAQQAAARTLRRDTLHHLPSLLSQLDEQARANGLTVFWAEDADAANRYIAAVAEARRVRQITRTHAAVLDELGLEAHLAAAGVQTVWTQLGDYVVTLAQDTPSHMVYPAFHQRKEAIAALFESKLDVPQTLDIQALSGIARFKLRRPMLEATLSVSGLTLAVAETGALAFANESGDQRLAASVAPIQVAVMGLEQVTPHLHDLSLLLPLLAASQQGHLPAGYTTLLTRPVAEDEDADGPREIHLIILDNGRSDLLRWGYGEILACIQCGACQTVCPVYREIGGHAYSPRHSGPAGSALLPLLPAAPGSETTGSLRSRLPWPVAAGKQDERNTFGMPPAGNASFDLAHASTLCGACAEVCPVGIDLPRLLVALRTHQAAASPPLSTQAARRLFGWAMADANRYRMAQRWLQQSRWPRSLPRPAAQSFRERWQARRTA